VDGNVRGDSCGVRSKSLVLMACVTRKSRSAAMRDLPRFLFPLKTLQRLGNLWVRKMTVTVGIDDNDARIIHKKGLCKQLTFPIPFKYLHETSFIETHRIGVNSEAALENGILVSKEVQRPVRSEVLNTCEIFKKFT
jgi:hypothetical protein